MMRDTLKKSTRKIFDDLVNNHGASYIPNLKNPIKLIGDQYIMYCLYKDNIHECYIDKKNIKKISIGVTWVATGRKDRTTIYVVCNKRRKRISLHTLLMNTPDGMEVDHKDGNGLNNLEENLRIVNHAENMLNKKQYKNNKSGMVNMSEKDGYYIVSVLRKYNNKEIALEVSNKVNELVQYYSTLDKNDNISNL